MAVRCCGTRHSGIAALWHHPVLIVATPLNNFRDIFNGVGNGDTQRIALVTFAPVDQERCFVVFVGNQFAAKRTGQTLFELGLPAHQRMPGIMPFIERIILAMPPFCILRIMVRI